MFAQAEADPPSEDVIRIDTNLVAVPVYVTDQRGKRLHGLFQEDFQIFDDGRPVNSAYFASGTERVALTFLLDASGSTRDTITQQRETAAALLARFGATSRVSVIRFHEQPEVVVSFTTDQSKVREAFRLPLTPDRRTAIFDATLAAVRNYQTVGGDPAERRIIILISDGLDTASTMRAADVTAAASARGVSIYVVHLPLFAPRDGRLAPRPLAKGFRALAEQTGGQFFTVGDARSSLDPHASHNLAPIFQAIAEDLQGQYVLGFYAPDATPRDGRSHRLEVQLSTSKVRSPNHKLRVHMLRANYSLQRP